MSDLDGMAKVLLDNAAANIVRRVCVDGCEFVVAPKDWAIHDLEEYRACPSRVEASHTFLTVGSLVAYIKRYCNTVTDCDFVTSCAHQGVISAVLDYHGGAERPGWCRHVATFKAVMSPEYKAWRGLHRKPVSQVDACEFLEDRAFDVVEPAGADIMEMIMKFEALKKVTFSSSMRLRDGNVQVLYQEDTEARGALTIPDTITLLVPVFEGMEPDRITVRLRFRIVDGALKFSFVIARIEELERQAFERCEDAFRKAMPDTILHRV